MSGEDLHPIRLPTISFLATQQSPFRRRHDIRRRQRRRRGPLLVVFLQGMSLLAVWVLSGHSSCAYSSCASSPFVGSRMATASTVLGILLLGTTTRTARAAAEVTGDVKKYNDSMTSPSDGNATAPVVDVYDDDNDNDYDDTVYPDDESWQTVSQAPFYGQNDNDDGEKYEPDKGMEEGQVEVSSDSDEYNKSNTNSTMNQKDNDDFVGNSSFSPRPPETPLLFPDHPHDNFTNHTVHFDLYVALPPRTNGVGHLLKPTVTYYLNLISTVYHVEMTPDDPSEAKMLEELGDTFGIPPASHDQNVTIDLTLMPHMYTKIIYEEETQWWWRYPFHYAAKWHDTQMPVNDTTLQQAQEDVYGYLLQATADAEVLKDKLFMLMHEVLETDPVSVYQVLLTPPWLSSPPPEETANGPLVGGPIDGGFEPGPPPPPPCNGHGKTDCPEGSDCGMYRPCHANDDDVHEQPSAGDDAHEVGCDHEHGWNGSGGPPCSSSTNASKPTGEGFSNNINLVTPLDARKWDWRRYLGLGLLLGTISVTLCLAQLAALRRHHRIQKELWGRKNEEEKEKQKHLYLGSEEGVDALLRMGWSIQGSKMEVYMKNEETLYNESMLMGGYEPKESVLESAGEVTGTTATPSEMSPDTMPPPSS